MRLTPPDRMGDEAAGGDLLVLAPGDQPPSGAQPLLEEVVTVGSPVVTVTGPDSTRVTLVVVYRR
jgi:hypothetical protein